MHSFIHDNIEYIAMFILVTLFGALLIGVYLQGNRVSKCKTTALDNGFPDYEYRNNTCYGKSLHKAKMLYKEVE